MAIPFVFVLGKLGASGAQSSGIVNFLATGTMGLLVILFAIGLGRGVTGSRHEFLFWRWFRDHLGPFMIFLVGLFWILTALCSPSCPAPFSSVPNVQIVLSLAASFFFIEGAIILHRDMKRTAVWEWYGSFSLLVASVGVITLVTQAISGIPTRSPSAEAAQLVDFALWFTWIFILSSQLWRLNRDQIQIPKPIKWHVNKI